MSVAADKNVVSEWQDFYKGLGIDISKFDIESSAVFRGLFSEKLKNPIGIVDIGARATNIALYDSSGIVYAHTANIGGDRITQEISEKLQVSLEEAEKLKRENGILSKNKDLAQIITKIIHSLAKEIFTALQFVAKERQIKVGELLLVGGSAQLEGIVEYLAKVFKINVKIGKSSYLSTNTASVEYIEAVGLARGCSSKVKNGDLFIKLESKKTKLKKAPKDQQKKPKQEDVEDSREDSTKQKKQIIMLVIILIFGAIAIFLAFWFKNTSKTDLEQVKTQVQSQYSVSQTIPLTVEVVVKPEFYVPDKINGKLLNYRNLEANTEDPVLLLDLSKEWAKNQLAGNEILLEEPFEKTSSTTAWLAFSKKQADSLFLGQLKEVNHANTKYILDEVLITSLVSDEQDHFIKAEVRISADKLINFD